MPRRRRYPQTLQALLDEARRNEAGTPPRKHHLVPASYLRRWAEHGRVRVTVVDESRSYLASPETAARETDFYRLEHPELDPAKLPPLLFETMLSKIEDNAKRVIDDMLTPPDAAAINVEALALFSLHLAMSITRGKSFRAEQQAMVADFFRLQWEDVTDDGLKGLLRRSGIDPTTAEVARHRALLDELHTGRLVVEQPEAAVIAMSAQIAVELGEHLFARDWQVYQTPPILVTCDEPVVILGGPGAPRDERSGVGEAGVVMYPLSPSALLVMFHPEMQPAGPAALDHAETAEINREIIASASRWAFERPSRRVTERLQVPKAPASLFLREGPLPPADESVGEIYRLFRPTRWSSDNTVPPWPVARWWRGWQAREFPRLKNLPPGATVAVRGEANPRGRGYSARGDAQGRQNPRLSARRRSTSSQVVLAGS